MLYEVRIFKQIKNKKYGIYRNNCNNIDYKRIDIFGK